MPIESLSSEMSAHWIASFRRYVSTCWIISAPKQMIYLDWFKLIFTFPKLDTGNPAILQRSDLHKMHKWHLWNYVAQGSLQKEENTAFIYKSFAKICLSVRVNISPSKHVLNSLPINHINRSKCVTITQLHWVHFMLCYNPKNVHYKNAPYFSKVCQTFKKFSL